MSEQVTVNLCDNNYGRVAVEIDPGRLLDIPKSKMLRLLVLDVEAAERAETVEIEMGNWHSPMVMRSPDTEEITAVCSMCLAGCAMRGLGVPDDVIAWPDDFSRIRYGELSRLFNSLDSLRSGIMPNWGYYDEDDDEYRKIRDSYSPYDMNPVRFKNWILKFADWLESKGL